MGRSPHLPVVRHANAYRHSVVSSLTRRLTSRRISESPLPRVSRTVRFQMSHSIARASQCVWPPTPGHAAARGGRPRGPASIETHSPARPGSRYVPSRAWARWPAAGRMVRRMSPCGRSGGKGKKVCAGRPSNRHHCTPSRWSSASQTGSGRPGAASRKGGGKTSVSGHPDGRRDCRPGAWSMTAAARAGSRLRWPDARTGCSLRARAPVHRSELGASVRV